MKPMKLTRVTPIRNENHEIIEWEKDEEYRCNPMSIESWTFHKDLGKVVITFKGGNQRCVNEKLHAVDQMFFEATHQ